MSTNEAIQKLLLKNEVESDRSRLPDEEREKARIWIRKQTKKLYESD